jgi:glyoxylase-like metal-dependent hydrolase (beta-lactamase superfamily II)
MTLIEQWTGPPVETHAYLLYDRGAGEAWAVDAPLETAAALLGRVGELGGRLSRVILTHGHFDHILDVGRYQEAGVPVAACLREQAVLDVPQDALFGLSYPMPHVTITEPLVEGTRLRLGASEWEVWEVPGHSPGHLILHCPAERIVMGGDLLFRGGYGRVDLPGADPAAMADSLARLLALPGDTRVYPGHGPATCVAAEREWLAPLLRR